MNKDLVLEFIKSINDHDVDGIIRFFPIIPSKNPFCGKAPRLSDNSDKNRCNACPKMPATPGKRSL